jgi:divalent metal cation (Fe/Co/Zn/Cd) transporter
MSGVELRPRFVRQALLIEIFTISYNAFEAIAALWIGLASGSASLETFGLDSLIEIGAGLILVWRLNAEQRSADEERVELVERRATRLVGWSLLALAVYVALQSISELVTQAKPEPSLLGILLAVASLILMPLLGRRKLQLADKISSRALHADAFETIACAYLSFTLLLGLAANYFFGWWWADPLAALVMIYFIGREAREAFSAEEAE